MKMNYRGMCVLCGKTTSKSAMSRHLRTCVLAHECANEKVVRWLLFRVEGSGMPVYWLDIECKADARLTSLDIFLRRIWLECCGHLSAFRIGQMTYLTPVEREPFDLTNERGQNVALSRALRFHRGWFKYEYDFGSTTELRLRVEGERMGIEGRDPVRLLARNEAPNWSCRRCQKQATLICAYCVYEADPFFCETHARSHKCEDDAFLPVVNSPRAGICGYTGTEY